MDPEMANRIQLFRRLFEQKTDKTERQTLLRLLAEEEEKLKAAAKPREHPSPEP
jgi:hypothetical protein